MAKLTENELQVLRMLNGEIELPWGAWVAACLEYLQGAGLATGVPYRITEAGRQRLRQTDG